MEIEHYHPGMVKSEIAVELLKKKGITVTKEEAEQIVETLTFLTNLSIDQILEEEQTSRK